jgi:signal transduction histidine kinase
VLKKLRIKFVCIMMVVVTAMLIVIFGLVLHFMKANLEENSIQMLRNIANDPLHHMGPGRPNEPPEEMRLPYFTLEIGSDGELISTGGDYYDLSDEDFLREMMEAALSSGEHTGIIEQYNLRFLRAVTPVSQRLVFADISSELATMDSLIKTCVLIGVMSFLAFLILSVFLAYWAVKPVDKAWRQQKQFVSDASHELKTPLTVIMTNAELLRSTDYDEASKRQFTENILQMTKQMRNLVTGLLELARVDNGKVKSTITDLNFSELVSEAVLPFEPLYFEKGLSLHCHIENDIRLKGSKSHLRQVLEILLDNAMKYAAPQASVEVSLKRQGLHCILSVANPGEPISEDDLKNIFKRFYRTDKARSANGSYGLGLAIAESIIEEHKGKIWAESAKGINTFYLQLPLYNSMVLDKL